MNTNTDPRVKLEELTARRDAVTAEVDGLLSRSLESLTPGEQTRAGDLARALKKLDGEMFEARKEIDRAKLDAGQYATEGGTGDAVESFSFNRGATIDRAAWNVDAARLGPDQMVDQAQRVLDTVHRSTAVEVPTEGIERVAEMLSGNEAEQAAPWTIAASDPAYRSAFAKLVMDPTRGHLEWDDVERAAYSRAQQVSRTINRGLNLTDHSALVPFTLDPSVILTSSGSINPIRALARNVTTMSDSWNGVSSAGVTAEWKVEAAAAADATPSTSAVAIPTFLGDAYVPYSFEWSMDALSGLEELAKLLMDAADQLNATAFTTGNGTSAPGGLITGLAGTASEINTTGSEAIVFSDAFALQNALPARFSANATFQSHIAVANTFRQFETSNGALQFPELRDNPPYLLGKRWYENSNMDGSIDAAATANNYVLAYGDIFAAMTVVNRAAATIELIPHVIDQATGRPTGERAAFMWWRQGSKVTNIAAARLLDVPTTA